MMAPTLRQIQIWAFIKGWIDKNQFCPSYEEIRLSFGFRSRNAVKHHLILMQKKGMLTRPQGVQRRIRLVGVYDAPTQR